MKKRNRTGGGGGSGGGGLWRQKQNKLMYDLDHISKFDNPPDFSNEDDVVHHLLDEFGAYKRQPLRNLRKLVLQTLPEFNRRRRQPQSQPLMSGSSEEDEEEETTPKRPKRRDDREEEKLQRTEDAYLRRKQRSNHDRPSSSSSDNDDDDGDEASTSEDAIYGEEIEPKFDLMKSMLRKSYTEPKPAAKSKAAVTAKAKAKAEQKKEKNLEIENLGREKVKAVSTEANRASESEAKSSVSRGVEVKGKEGPKFTDLGGMQKVLEELNKEIIRPLRRPWLPQWLGVKPMSGILLCGPPGCGKTTLAHAIANETGIPFYKISATEVVSGISGASEENIRELFSKAYRTAPSIVFIDEIDAIGSKRENMQREMERRIVTQLMTCMDESHRPVQAADTNLDSQGSEQRSSYVLVIGATNRPDAVDPALRRPGRFGREILLGVPDEDARLEILSVITRKLRLEGSFDLLKIARSTPGYVGADLAELADRAGNIAMNRIFDEIDSKVEDGNEDLCRPPEEMETFAISMSDFEEAVLVVQPSSKREGFSAVPNVKWENVGGLDLLRKEFERYIVRRIKSPENYEKFGVNSETGFLLYGPPGCGKTLIAKAVANEAGANFIYIKGPELLNKYVGESELAVRTLFTRARTCSPCILFFDEVDALTTRRGKEGGWVVERLLNQLLIELDGADQRRGVFVIGATNRPDVMDRAFLRPGRFGKLIYVAPPSTEERCLILKAIARKYSIDASVDLGEIAKWQACENFSGADLAALMDEAAMTALDEKETSPESSDTFLWTIKESHFQSALDKITPSVTKMQLLYYQRFGESLKATRNET